MKLGIISLYYRNRNCGGLLQAFSLCKTLSSLGINAEQVCIDEKSFCKSEFSQKVISKVKKEGLFSLVCATRNKVKKKLRSRSFSGYIKSFSLFEAQIPHSEKVYGCSSIPDLANDYDLFISGSDQVWSWALKYIDDSIVDKSIKYNQLLDVYLLRFVPDAKLKIAYAPSIACPYIPDNLKQYYFDSINRLDTVSIREKVSLELFPDELKDKITPVCDPTFLLNSKQWCEALNLSEKRDGKYIFIYLLNPAKQDRVVVKRIKNITGLKTITCPNITMSPSSYDYHLADIDDFNLGPKEFVNYIKNASLVITNSFHAAVFSMQFHTPFYVVDRESKVSMGSRLDSLLDEYCLKDRKLYQGFSDAVINTYDNIDWCSVDDIFNRNRKFSLNWLKNALQLDVKQTVNSGQLD